MCMDMSSRMSLPDAHPARRRRANVWGDQRYPLVKIKCIRAYRADLPLHEGSYKWSGGKAVSVFDTTVVEVMTDSGIVGHGEVCPLGPFYLPAYANGVRAGIVELGPHLIGENPLHLAQLNRRMDAALKG